MPLEPGPFRRARGWVGPGRDACRPRCGGHRSRDGGVRARARPREAGTPLKPARIGCSGWQYADWRGAFYPERCPQRAWLEHYASVFDTVELNNTFYRLPKVDAVARWVQQTPPEFCFTVKVSRFATHMKR